MSLLGSILSNLLLVLGLCFIAGGLRYKTQNFNAVANKATSSVLFLAVTAIVLPVAASHLGGAHDSLPENFILDISRGTAIVVMVVYLLFVFFQLYTHVDLFVGGGEGGEDGGGEAEVPMMSAAAAMGGLAAVAVLVAACSEFLTGSIEAVSESTGFSPGFLGMIVLPIAGNACENISAVIVARKDKLDLSLGIAVGSSIQIASFAIPVVVLLAWAMGLPFSLDFDPFATLALTLAVIHSNHLMADASSHWLMGVMLVATYILIALVFVYK